MSTTVTVLIKDTVTDRSVSIVTEVDDIFDASYWHFIARSIVASSVGQIGNGRDCAVYIEVKCDASEHRSHSGYTERRANPKPVELEACAEIVRGVIKRVL